MSEIRYHKGTIRHFIFPVGVDDWNARVAYLRMQGIRFESVDIEAQTFESEDVIEIDNRWFLVYNDEQFDPESIAIVKMNDDLSYDYTISYYDGCTSWEEKIKEAIRKNILGVTND